LIQKQASENEWFSEIRNQFDESILLGGERCRTTVRLWEKKAMDGIGDK
jgi:hypothetical protein